MQIQRFELFSLNSLVQAMSCFLSTVYCKLPQAVQMIYDFYVHLREACSSEKNDFKAFQPLLNVRRIFLPQAGCVHVSHPSPHPSPHQQSDVKVIILLYSSEKKAYVGFVPIDQLSFVNKIKSVIQNARKCQVRTATCHV